LSCVQAVVGEDGVRTGREIMTMGGEDFSYFLQERPGCFVFVGATAADAEAKPHHHPSFDFDEGCLAIGASLWVKLAQTILA
jgi:hippurate hydrolase